MCWDDHGTVLDGVMSSRVFARLSSPRDTACFGLRVTLCFGPELDGSLVADVPVGVALCLFSACSSLCTEGDVFSV